jgi:hypothetical protein
MSLPCSQKSANCPCSKPHESSPLPLTFLRPILILSCFRALLHDSQDEFWIGCLDLLTPYTQYSRLQAITALSLMYTLYSSPLHTHYVSQSSPVVSWQRIYSRTVSLSLQITHEVFFSPPNSFLDIILQLPIPKTRLNSIPLLPSSYPGWLEPRNSTLHFTLCC